MDRAQLEHLTRTDAFTHRLTRDDLNSILKMVDAAEQRANEAETATYALTQDAINAAALLQARLEALAEHADQTPRPRIP